MSNVDDTYIDTAVDTGKKKYLMYLKNCNHDVEKLSCKFRILKAIGSGSQAPVSDTVMSTRALATFTVVVALAAATVATVHLKQQEDRQVNVVSVQRHLFVVQIA